MTEPVGMDGWPDGSAAVLWRVTASGAHPLGAHGDLTSERPWASVTKFAVATAAARQFAVGGVDLAAPAGPPGSTLSHLLAHASGLGLEAKDPVRAVGERRVYSNVGIDLAVATMAPERTPSSWLDEWVFDPLTLTAHLVDRPSSGARGTTTDLARLGAAWLDGTIPESAVARFTTVFLPELAGIVPGFGRFAPCPWGLGPEVHGAKAHWMGSRLSPRAFGHFGQSGALVIVDPTRSWVLAATSPTPFGGWAVAAWPSWVDAVVDRFDP